MENNNVKLSFQLLTVITTPKLAEKTADLFKKSSLPLHYRFGAEGTASSEIMDMLGLGSIDKCVLICPVPKPLSGLILKKLHTELKLDTVNSGIAFTVPVNGANNLLIRMLTQSTEEITESTIRKDESNMSEAKYVLITAIVNRGYSEDVMEAAKSAGAQGGTVIHSHSAGNEEVTGFWGLGVQDERDIVMILAPSENKLSIMSSITEKCGISSKANGVVFSMPIDSVIGVE